MHWTLDGGSAYAYTGGKPLNPSLPGLVLIHGALHDHSVWALQSRFAAHYGRAVLAVDLPAHGRSSGPARDIPGCAEWIVQMVRAAGLSRMVVAGHSMGSLIALEAAARLGSDAAHLVMVGSAYPMAVAPAMLAMARDEPLQAIDLVNALSHSTLAAKPSAPAPGFWLHGGNRVLMRRMLAGEVARGVQPNLFVHDFQACDAYRGLEDAASRLSCPTTLVLGARDQMTPPKAARELAQRLKARVITLDCGHALMTEAPDGVRNALMAPGG